MKPIKWALAALYLALLLYVVFFSRRRLNLVWHEGLLNLVPFTKSIQDYEAIPVQGWRNFYTNLLGNVVLFFPLPVFLVALFRVSRPLMVLAVGMGLSVSVEVVQYALRIGVPDIDDVLLNTLGVGLGLISYRALHKLIRRDKRKYRPNSAF